MPRDIVALFVRVLRPELQSIAAFARDDMEVCVHDDLTACWFYVRRDVRTFIATCKQAFSDELAREHDWLRFVRKQFGQIEAVFFRHDKRVAFADWFDVEERDAVVVLVHNLRRDFLGNDFAEQAVSHSGTYMNHPFIVSP